MTFFVISMSLSASLVQNQNNKSKINRNPPSYFLKRDGGFAYVISKPKKQKQVSTLQELVFIFIDNIFGFSDQKPCRLSQAGRDNYK